jgi:hypothetical protein
MVPMRFDVARQLRRPAIDLTPAREFGKACVLIQEGTDFDLTSMFDMQPLVNQMVVAMEDSLASDHVVAVGDPVLIAAAAGIQLDKFGSVTMLRWDRHTSKYKIMEFEL